MSNENGVFLSRLRNCANFAIYPSRLCWSLVRPHDNSAIDMSSFRFIGYAAAPVLLLSTLVTMPLGLFGAAGVCVATPVEMAYNAIKSSSQEQGIVPTITDTITTPLQEPLKSVPQKSEQRFQLLDVLKNRNGAHQEQTEIKEELSSEYRLNN